MQYSTALQNKLPNLFCCSFVFSLMAPFANHAALGGSPDLDSPNISRTLRLEAPVSKVRHGRCWAREPALGVYLLVVRNDSKEPGCLMNPTNRKICQNTQNAHCRDRGNIAYLFGARLIIFKHMQPVVQ